MGTMNRADREQEQEQEQEYESCLLHSAFSLSGSWGGGRSCRQARAGSCGWILASRDAWIAAIDSMRAIVFDRFQGPLRCAEVPDPALPVDGVVLRVKATGLCRSDWHAWQGHDPEVRLPHVAGHELAGVVEEVGSEVRRWRPGDRVTVPFVCACGECLACQVGDQQVCAQQYQPGFTGWGSFAERVALPRADLNLVRLPETVGFTEAASLGCRFATAFRGLIAQGRLGPGEWVAIHGCGGVGLSAVLIAVAAGAQVIAIDVSERALAMAREFGATHVVRSRDGEEIVGRIRAWTGGGAQVSVDALGSLETCRHSILGLRARGRHIQLGLMLAEQRNAAIPMDVVIARELELRGSHGMAAHAYGPMLEAMAAGRMRPARLIARTIRLCEVVEALPAMTTFAHPGVTVVDRFE